MNKVKLKLENIYQCYGDKATLNGINLEIMEGELLAILGPSGCGKTSLLKAIAGLIPIEQGKILLEGQPIQCLPPQSRKTAMIFQNYALFPHMTVVENIQYGLTIKKLKPEVMKDRLEKIMSLIQLKGYEHRKINELSGGQQQRVAIGRAMIVEPSILLFDEPLSNLDENLRIEMRAEIKKLVKAENITSIYVTHDQNEAMTMADRIVIMKEGQIEQIATPECTYNEPKTEYVAQFMGHKNIFTATVEKQCFQLLGHIFPHPSAASEGDQIQILLRSEEIDLFSFEEELIDQSNQKEFYLDGVIRERQQLTNVIQYLVRVEQELLTVTVLNRHTTRKWELGDPVRIRLKQEALHILNE